MDLSQFIIKLTKLHDFAEETSINLLQDDKVLILASKLNREQLLQGETINKTSIRPFHSENPFFESPEKVEAYINFKQSVIKKLGLPNTKNPDTPNLFINGKFHSEIEADKTKSGIELNASGIMSSRILPDFKNILGLNVDNVDKIANKYVIPALIVELNKYFST